MLASMNPAWRACRAAIERPPAVGSEGGWWEMGAMFLLSVELATLWALLDLHLPREALQLALAFALGDLIYGRLWRTSRANLRARQRAARSAALASAQPALVRLRILERRESQFQYSGIEVEIEERSWSLSTVLEGVHLLTEQGPLPEPVPEWTGQIKVVNLCTEPPSSWLKGTVVEEPALLLGPHSLQLLCEM